MVFQPILEITDKQKEIFFFIIDYLEENGFQPTTQEAATHFGISRRAASDRIDHLIRKGYLVAPPINRERSMKILNVRFEVEIDYEEIKKLEPISEKQADVWKIIIDFLAEHGYQPTSSEIAAMVGVSRSSISQRLNQLIDKGYIIPKYIFTDEEQEKRMKEEGKKPRATAKVDRAFNIRGLKLKVVPTDDEESKDRE